MVDEGKVVSRLVVVQVPAGSTPVIHPKHPLPSGDRNEAVTLVPLARWFDSIRVHQNKLGPGQFAGAGAWLQPTSLRGIRFDSGQGLKSPHMGW